MADQQIIAVHAAADASFLIGLCFAEQVHLLGVLVPRVFIAPAVWQEVVVRGSERPGAAEIANSPAIVRHDVQDRQAVESFAEFLGAGESETIVLAQEINCPLVLMDDLRARKAAQHAGKRVLGVVGFLLAAKRLGLLTEIRPSLDKLLACGFRLGATLLNRALQEAGEQ